MSPIKITRVPLISLASNSFPVSVRSMVYLSKSTIVSAPLKDHGKTPTRLKLDRAGGCSRSLAFILHRPIRPFNDSIALRTEKPSQPIRTTLICIFRARQEDNAQKENDNDAQRCCSPDDADRFSIGFIDSGSRCWSGKKLINDPRF